MSINVSICQMQQPDFSQMVLAILDEMEVPRYNILLEITESMAALSLQRIQEVCRNLRDNGIQIALDDFGTGYSSLNMIRTMPIDVIKIDRAFVNDITFDRYTYLFTRLITELGRLLEITVCAEGVETSEQLLRCREIGIDFIQGHLYHRAMPEQEFTLLMEQI